MDADHESRMVNVRFNETLPPVCVLCGTSATGTKTVRYDPPLTCWEIAVWVLKNLLPGRYQSLRDEDEQVENLLLFPVCPEHLSASLDSALRFRPRGRRMVSVLNASPEFCQAVRLASEQVARQMAALDIGPATDPTEFLRDLERRERGTY